MKGKISHLIVATALALGTFVATTDVASAYWCRDGYCNRGNGYYRNPNRVYVRATNCRMVGGYWAYGYYHSPRKVCYYR